MRPAEEWPEWSESSKRSEQDCLRCCRRIAAVRLASDSLQWRNAAVSLQSTAVRVSATERIKRLLLGRRRRIASTTATAAAAVALQHLVRVKNGFQRRRRRRLLQNWRTGERVGVPAYCGQGTCTLLTQHSQRDSSSFFFSLSGGEREKRVQCAV